MSDPVRRWTAAIATAVRRGDHHEADHLRTELRVEKLSIAIREALRQEPRLSRDQLERLRSLLPELPS